MQTLEKLEHGKFYHIYNHGVGGRDLFREAPNYAHFLSQYDKYISTIAETYAWCLMPNHFHLLVRIKEDEKIGFYKKLNSVRSDDSGRFQTTADLSAFGEPERVDITKLKRQKQKNHICKPLEKLEHGQFYHIYNHGVGGRDLFREAPQLCALFVAIRQIHKHHCRNLRLVPHAKPFSFVGADKGRCCL
jgi:hypothetical protein